MDGRVMEPSRMALLAGVADEINRTIQKKGVSVKIVDGYVRLIAHGGEYIRLYAEDGQFEISEM